MKVLEVLMTDTQGLGDVPQPQRDCSKRGKSVKNQEEVSRQLQGSVKVGQHGVCSLHPGFPTGSTEPREGKLGVAGRCSGSFFREVKDLGFRDAKLNRKRRECQPWPEVPRPTASAPNPGC